MRALLETLADMACPKPNEHASPKWKRPDYVALVILSLVVFLVRAFWPL